MRNWINTLWFRLALISLLVTWAAIGVVALSVGSVTEASFRSYVQGQNVQRFGADVITALEDYYAANGGWEGAELPQPGEGSGQGGGQGRGGSGQRGAQMVVADPSGHILLATDETLVGEMLSPVAQEGAALLSEGDHVVGLLAQITPGTQALGDAEAAFLAQTQRGLLLAAVAAGLVAVVLGLVLAWGVTRPLRSLTDAVRDLSGGALGRQAPLSGPVEMVTLARSFNAMSADLAEGEQQRQRMAADVAHELRTPVSVLRGRLEAMLDGVFPLDSANLAVAYDQTLHIARLVDDLRLLTMAEAGRLPLERTLAQPGAIAAQAVALFEPLALDAGVTLAAEIAPDLPLVLADVDRLRQVFGNLLSNALRHTPEGYAITVQVSRAAAGVQIDVRNTGSRLTAEEIAHLFDRFWRAEEARARDSGGSGLGLAITRQLVRLHGGDIRVSSDAQSVTFTFTLPAAG